MIADFAVVQRIPDQPLKRSSQQRTGRAHPRVVSTTDQPRTQHLSQRPSMHLQTDGTLLTHKQPPGGLCDVLLPQDLMKPVNRRLCGIRLCTTRHNLVAIDLVTVVGRDHYFSHAQ